MPVNAHPFFPGLAALWFAALFGLGTLVLPAAVLEATVHAIRLDAIVPAAAAPLGLATRVLMALAAGMAGMAGGLALARRIAVRHPASGAAFAAEPAWRPLSLPEETGLARFDDAMDMETRAIGEEEAEQDHPSMLDPISAPISRPTSSHAGSPANDSAPPQPIAPVESGAAAPANEPPQGTASVTRDAAGDRPFDAMDLDDMDIAALAERLASAIRNSRRPTAAPATRLTMDGGVTHASLHPLTFQPDPQDEQEEEAETAETGDDAAFSSLLSMGQPAVRPAIPAPVERPQSHAPIEPDEQEHALRTALATLQKLSGAA